MGLVAAPLVHTAVSSSVAEPDSVVRVESARHNIASQSSSQSDSQSDTHSPRVTDSLPRLRDSTGKSRDGGLSSGHTQSLTVPTALSPQPNAEPLDNRCTEEENQSEICTKNFSHDGFEFCQAVTSVAVSRDLP